MVHLLHRLYGVDAPGCDRRLVISQSRGAKVKPRITFWDAVHRVSRLISPSRNKTRLRFNQVLSCGYNYDLTAIRSRYDHTTSRVTNGLVLCGLNK